MEAALGVEAGEGRGSGSLASEVLTALFLCLNKGKKGEKREGETKKKREKITSKRIHTKKKKEIKPKPNQTTNSNIPNTHPQRVANMDILFISLVTWSYKYTWQNPLRTQKNRTLMNQCEVRGHDILGGQKHNGNLAQCC